MANMLWNTIIFVVVLATLTVQEQRLIKSTVQKLRCADVKTLIDQHNVFRLKLALGQIPGQPAASNMKHLVWDDELAMKAEKHVAKGKFVHNTNKVVPSKRFTTGENMYTVNIRSNGQAAVVNVSAPVISWFSEHEHYKYGKIAGNTVQSTGHYTQIAWAHSTYLGCGVSKKVVKGLTVFLYVCYYGPAGNHLGEYPYETGPGCTGFCGAPSVSELYGNNC